MEIQKIEAIIEAVLFASGDAISIDKLSEITKVDMQSLKSIIILLSDKYNYEKRGIKIIQVGNKFQMTSRGEYFEYVQQIIEPRKKNPLSKATLEVLSIIAYKQPVTRTTIEHIRGVNCDNSVSRLVDLNLIEEVGRLEAPGRPVLFGTTDEFLRSFAISNIDELLPLEEYVIDEIVNMNNFEEIEK